MRSPNGSAKPPVLAGSGATWFTERAFTDDERDNALGDLVDEGARVVATSTTASRSPSDDSNVCYLRRWWRVRRSIFLCFFFRMRLRRFLIREPIRRATLSGVASGATRRYRDAWPARPSRVV